MIDTGKILGDFMKINRISKSELARKIDRNCATVMKYLHNNSIQIRILWAISHATKHNFFQDLANRLPSDFTVTNDLISPKDKRIAELEEEVKVLKIQNEVLMRVRS